MVKEKFKDIKWAWVARVTGGFLVFVFLCMLLLPTLLHGWISRKVIDLSGEYLQTELRFTDTRVSFFRDFPSLTLTMEDALLMGSGPYRDQTLIESEELIFTMSIWRLLFSGQIDIDEIQLRNSKAEFKTDTFGRVNYSILKSEDPSQDPEEESDLDLILDRVHIENADILYSDQLRGLEIRTRGFDYHGNGSFREKKLELGSRLEVDSVDVTVEEIAYLKHKRLKANMFIEYDDKSLSLLFKKDSLSINDLDLSFKGELDLEREGFSYEIEFLTKDSHLRDILSLLPPQYNNWRKKLDLSGMVDAQMVVIGQQSNASGTEDIPHIDLNMELRGGRLKYEDAQLPFEDVFFDLSASLDKTIFDIHADTLSFTLGDDFSRGHFFAKGRPDSMNLKARLHAALNLHTLQESLQLPSVTFGGHLLADVSSEGIYAPEASRFPVTDSEITVTEGYFQTDFPHPVEDIALDFELINSTGILSRTALNLKNLSFEFENSPFQMSAWVSDMEVSDYDIQAKGALDLDNLGKVIPIPRLTDLTGFMRLDARFKGHMESKIPGERPVLVTDSDSGTLFLEDVVLKVQGLPKPLKIVSGDFTFRVGKLEFSEFQVEYGNNSSILNGYFKDYINYFLLPDGVLKGDFKYKSDFVDLDALLPKQEILAELPVDSINLQKSVTSEVVEEITGVLQVPARISFNLDMDIDTLRYFQLDITKLQGQLTITEGGFLFNDTRMNMVGGTAEMKGYYRPQGNDRALFSYYLKGKNLDVKRAYNEINLFTDLVPAAANAEGIISLDYEIKGILDRSMNPIIPSLEGGGTLSVHDVQFKNYKFFGSVSRETRLSALNDPTIQEITIHSTVDDNLLELERFKFKVHPFRLRLEGETTLNGDMDLQMRLGLPPFGLIGIPIKITGTSDSLKIKMGRRERDLEALEYEDDALSEQERLRFRMLRDSITEEMSIEQIDAFEKRMDSLYYTPIPKETDSIVTPIMTDTLETLGKPG